MHIPVTLQQMLPSAWTTHQLLCCSSNGERRFNGVDAGGAAELDQKGGEKEQDGGPISREKLPTTVGEEGEAEGWAHQAHPVSILPRF